MRNLVFVSVLLIVALVTSVDASAQSRSENSSVYAYGSWTIWDEGGEWVDIYSFRAQTWEGTTKYTDDTSYSYNETSWNFRLDRCTFLEPGPCPTIFQEEGNEGIITHSEDRVSFEGGGYSFEATLYGAPGTYQNKWKSTSPEGCSSNGETHQNWWRGSEANLSIPSGEVFSSGYGHLSEEASSSRSITKGECGSGKG